jgi:sugar lactone lactonase YvrE
MIIQTVTNHKCLLGEGPVWDAKRREIYWIDILNGAVHQYAFDTDAHRIYPAHELIGSLAITENGDFIVALKSGIAFMDRQTGALKRAINPENHLSNNRFNDGKCDPHGRFWAGTMSLSEEPNAGSLYVFEQGKIERKVENLTISNGLAWSLDHKTLYFIDTPTFEVTAFDYEKTTGNIKNRRVAFKISKKDGYPDGMTIDTEGCLWIAHWDGWQVTRWQPETGEKLLSIALPVARVTSCTFGGNDLTDLFITSASVGLSESDLAAQPLAGTLFVLRDCGFQGVEAVRFKS